MKWHYNVDINPILSNCRGTIGCTFDPVTMVLLYSFDPDVLVLFAEFVQYVIVKFAAFDRTAMVIE